MDFLSSPDLIRNIDNQSGVKYQELDQLLKLISKELSTINEQKAPSLSLLIQTVKTTDPCDFDAIGFPGTLETAFSRLSETFTKLLKMIQTTGQQMLSELNSKATSANSPKNQEFQGNLNQLESSINRFKNLQTSAKTLSNPLVQDCQEFCRMTQEKKNEFSTEGNAFDQTRYEAIYDNIIKFRKDQNANRINILSHAQQLIFEIQKYNSSCINFLKQNIQNVQKLFEWYQNISLELANGLSEIASHYQSIIPTLNFQSDFTSFITDNGIVRYDAMDTTFVQYNTLSPAFEGIEVPPLDDEKPIVPIGLARVIKTYQSQGQNETSCTAGNFVYIAEEMDQKWCYVMNTASYKSGFVPTCCLERVSKKFAYVPNDISTTDGYLPTGDFVAVIDENNEEQTFRIVTAKGVNMTVKQEELMVIYS